MTTCTGGRRCSWCGGDGGGGDAGGDDCGGGDAGGDDCGGGDTGGDDCGGEGGADAAMPWFAVIWKFHRFCRTTEFTSVGTDADGWASSAAWTLAAKSPETRAEIPLFATVLSVGTVRAPPVLPGRPSSCASSAPVWPCGAGAGLDGTVPGPD